MRRKSSSLQEIAHGLGQMLCALRDAMPVDIVETELMIPFVGNLVRQVPSPGLEGFRTVSFLTEDIERSEISDIWTIHISIGLDQPGTLRLEKYEASTTT